MNTPRSHSGSSTPRAWPGRARWTRAAGWLLLALTALALLAACDGDDDGANAQNGGGGGSGLPGDASAVSDVADEVMPSVFRVGVNCQDGNANQCQGGGSGWAYDDQGHVVTNNHVVTLGNQQPPPDTVLLSSVDGETLSAEVVGTDRLTDLAVLRIEDGQDVEPLSLSEDGGQLGEWVVAVGYALDLGGAPSVTTGVISAEQRVIQQPTLGFYGALQTDAAINPGNSGGPLVDLDGAVVGVNTAGIQGAEAIGFAINVETVRNVANTIIEEGGAIERGFIGVSFQPVTEQVANELDLEDQQGVVIVEVVPGSPADEAGLEPGDVIRAVGERTIEQGSDLPLALIEHPPGSTVEIQYIRDGEEETVSVTLAESPQQ